jgi:glycosyltransferase involved in cell wall biosynthesis
LEIIIQAIPRVCEVFPDAVFVLRDYSARADYRAMLKTLIADLSVQDRVRWLASLNGFEEIVDTYRLADAVVSIPSSDGTPVSVLEAMACGTPVIVSDLSSLREWIINGENGLLVPVKDAEALAEAIVLLLRDEKMYAKFRGANLDLVRERANHQVEMEKMERLYQSLL